MRITLRKLSLKIKQMKSLPALCSP